MGSSDDSFLSFIGSVAGDSHVRVEENLGDGFVRLRVAEAERAYAAETAPSASVQDEAAFNDAVFELALKELLSDPSIRGRTKQVFIRVAVNGEKPAAVAEAFGLSRNAVDQIKNRLVAKLQVLAANLRGE